MNHSALIGALDIDDAVAALFSSLTADIGRPFQGTWSHLRRVPAGWCPLSQNTSPLCSLDFINSYMPAHFFDRYIFTKERKGRALENLSLERFLEGNFIGSTFNKRLAVNNGEYLDEVLAEASLMCYRILGDFDYIEVFEACNHGPGAAVGVRMRDANLASKVLSPIGTSAAHDIFRQYRQWNTNLDAYLRRILPSNNEEVHPIVRGNKLSFVPKKFDRLRTMQVEPPLNEFFQLGTGSVMADRLLKRANIDLTSQDKCNGMLARWASKHGYLATLDWSDASGRIWVNLIRRLVPPDWFRWLMAIRSPVTSYGGKEVTLEMMGTMGNGFTFPLQTLVFYSLLRALARHHSLPEYVTVFGDDCIVDLELLPHVEALADLLGFKLNTEKSFGHGGFRESCGTDAWRGLDCRPFFVERPESGEPDVVKAWVYTCFNGLSSRYKHLHLAQCLDWVFAIHDRFHLGNVMVVPPRFPDTSGIKCATPERLHVSTPAMYYDKHGGVSFKFHAFRPEKREVTQEPYYIWKLMGKGVPLSFGKGIIPTFGDVEFMDHMPDSTGKVPGKSGSYKTSRRTHVHTWAYHDQ